MSTQRCGIFPKAREIDSFMVRDAAGKDWTPKRLQGSPTLVIFGYPGCQQSCPEIIQTVQAIRAAHAIKVLFVSVNDNQCLVKLKALADEHDFIATRGCFEDVMHSLGENKPMKDPSEHPKAIFALDSESRWVGWWRVPADVERVVSDLGRVA